MCECVCVRVWVVHGHGKMVQTLEEDFESRLKRVEKERGAVLVKLKELDTYLQVAKQVLLVAESRAQGAKLAYQELEEKMKNMGEVSQLDERTSELQGLRARVEDLEHGREFLCAKSDLLVAQRELKGSGDELSELKALLHKAGLGHCVGRFTGRALLSLFFTLYADTFLLYTSIMHNIYLYP